MLGTVTVDGYNSDKRPYRWTVDKNQALISAAGNRPNVVMLNGWADIAGDIQVLESNARKGVKNNGRSSMTGQVTTTKELADLKVPDPGVDEHAPGFSIPPLGERVVGNRDGTPASYAMDRLSMAGLATMRVVGPVTMHVNNNASFSNLSKVRITEAGQLDLYVGGDLKVSDLARLNALSNQNEKLNIYMTGSGQAKMEDNAVLRGSLIGPEAKMHMKDRSQLYGRLYGERIHLNGNGRSGHVRVHHDRALDNKPASSGKQGESTRSFSVQYQ
jgi:hypothetical protein